MLLVIALHLMMPVIVTVAGVTIYMYFRDHNPPHFHAKEGGDEEVFDLDGESMKGGISPKKHKKVRKWAKKNQDFLKDQWDEHQK